MASNFIRCQLPYDGGLPPIVIQARQGLAQRQIKRNRRKRQSGYGKGKSIYNKTKTMQNRGS
ncbi:hypothetical protein DWZ51_00425 [Bacteroides eggerthii]|nr:hypothetical protein DWZ51_00425 [Bacteroides eggerthii]